MKIFIISLLLFKIRNILTGCYTSSSIKLHQIFMRHITQASHVNIWFIKYHPTLCHPIIYWKIVLRRIHSCKAYWSSTRSKE